MAKHRSGGRAGRPARFVCIDVIRDLHSQGFSFRAIARCTGLGYGTVRRAFHGMAPLGVDQTADRQKNSAALGAAAGQTPSDDLSVTP